MPELTNTIQIHLSGNEMADLHKVCRASRKTIQAFARKVVMAAVHRALAEAAPVRRRGRPATQEAAPKGVRWSRRRGVWQVFVTAPSVSLDRDRDLYVGQYRDLQEACIAVEAARAEAASPEVYQQLEAAREGRFGQFEAELTTREWVREAARRAVRDHRVAQAQIPPDVRDAIMG